MIVVCTVIILWCLPCYSGIFKQLVLLKATACMRVSTGYLKSYQSARQQMDQAMFPRARFYCALCTDDELLLYTVDFVHFIQPTASAVRLSLVLYKRTYVSCFKFVSKFLHCWSMSAFYTLLDVDCIMSTPELQQTTLLLDSCKVTMSAFSKIYL